MVGDREGCGKREGGMRLGKGCVKMKTLCIDLRKGAGMLPGNEGWWIGSVCWVGHTDEGGISYRQRSRKRCSERATNEHGGDWDGRGRIALDAPR